MPSFRLIKNYFRVDLIVIKTVLGVNLKDIFLLLLLSCCADISYLCLSPKLVLLVF